MKLLVFARKRPDVLSMVYSENALIFCFWERRAVFDAEPSDLILSNETVLSYVT